MGYDMHTTIEVRPVAKSCDTADAESALRDLLEKNGFDPEEWTDGVFSLEDSGWYDYGEKVVKLSEKYPDVFFEVTSEGEEYGDIWSTYCCRGHIQDGDVLQHVPFSIEACVAEVDTALLCALTALKKSRRKDDDPLIVMLNQAIDEQIREKAGAADGVS